MTTLRTLFITLLIPFVFCSAQLVDLNRASAVIRTSGSANLPELIDFGNSQKGLMMSVTFNVNDGYKRAVWDLPLRADLSQMAGIKLRVFCENPDLASQFILHVRTNDGWMGANFEISGNKQWEDIFLPKTRFSPEGNMVSWKNCDILRLAAWKGSPGNMIIYVASIEFVRTNLSLAIIRGNGSGQPQKLKESLRHAHNLYQGLSLHGMTPAVIDENDLAYSTLKPYKMILIPLPDSLAAPQMNNVNSYLYSGGKAGVFHALTPALAAQMDTPLGKFMSSSNVPGAIGGVIPVKTRYPKADVFRQLSTSFIAVEKLPTTAYTSGWWMNCSGQQTKWPAIIETSAGFWMTHVYLNQDPYNGGKMLQRLVSVHVPETNRESARCLLQRANNLFSFAQTQARQQAKTHLSEAYKQFSLKNYDKAAYFCMIFREALRSTAQKASPAKANEIRAVWCRHTAGLPGHGWEQTIPLLHNSGFNTVFPLTASPFFSTFNSRIVPKTQGQGLKECLDAGQKHGTHIHAWINCLGVEDAPETTLQEWEKQGRLQVGLHGQRINWLCPNNQQNRTLLSRIVTEIASNHQVEGVHFDRIRYPAKDSCYCETCRRAFIQQIGYSPLPWPAAVRGGDGLAAWETFREQSINSVLRELSSTAVTANGNIMVSAAVYPDSALARQNVGQNWSHWCKQHWVSFVCPMSYRGSTTLFQGDLKRALQQAGDRNMLIPGIGSGPSHLNADELARQIAAVRAAGTPGFIIFDLGQREAYELLPALKRMGVTQ